MAGEEQWGGRDHQGDSKGPCDSQMKAACREAEASCGALVNHPICCADPGFYRAGAALVAMEGGGRTADGRTRGGRRCSASGLLICWWVRVSQWQPTTGNMALRLRGVPGAQHQWSAGTPGAHITSWTGLTHAPWTKLADRRDWLHLKLKIYLKYAKNSCKPTKDSSPNRRGRGREQGKKEAQL